MRKMSWFILVVNALFLIWVIAGASSAGPAMCDPGTTLTAAECESLSSAGKGLGIGMLIVLWTLVDVILLVIWLVTKPKAKPQIIYVQAPQGFVPPMQQAPVQQVPPQGGSSPIGDLYR